MTEWFEFSRLIHSMALELFSLYFDAKWIVELKEI